MFKTEEPSLDLQDAIYRTLVPGEASVTNGPVFRDYNADARVPSLTDHSIPVEPAVEPVAAESKMRVWTTVSGKQFEAEYVSVIGDQVVFKTARGKQLKVLVTDLTADDREVIELDTPPEFSITFVKSSEPRFIETTPHLNEDAPRVNDWTFGVKVKQTGARAYNHELTVEYFAIGKELIGDKFILLDRRTSSFTPNKENSRSHAFAGEDIEFMEYVFDGQRRGMEYKGNLVTITDKRGKVIQHSASNDWLWENIENLKKIPVGRFMDKTCKRVHPTSPKPVRY